MPKLGASQEKIALTCGTASSSIVAKMASIGTRMAAGKIRSRYKRTKKQSVEAPPKRPTIGQQEAQEGNLRRKINMDQRQMPRNPEI